LLNVISFESPGGYYREWFSYKRERIKKIRVQ
jgi:hypothetical protein